MRKYVDAAIAYAACGLVAGVLYREITKAYDYVGETALSGVHGHLLALGCGGALLLALFSRHVNLDSSKLYRPGIWLYNGGLILACVMMVVRGYVQVLGSVNGGIPMISDGADAAISGIAGLGHILLAVGIILLLITIRQGAEKLDDR